MVSSKNLHQQQPRIALFLQTLDGGGAERAIIHLANQIAKRGYGVDLLTGDISVLGPEVDRAVRLFNFNTRSPIRILLHLVAYLRKVKPAVTMSALDIPNILLIFAKHISGYRGRVVVSQRAAIAAIYVDEVGHCIFKSKIFEIILRYAMRDSDSIISNSYYAAKELVEKWGIKPQKLSVIYNFLDINRIKRLSKYPLEAPYSEDEKIPTIISVGSLTLRKDHLTLVNAFSIVRKKVHARLVILGEGKERGSIENLIKERALEKDVYLPGFDINPYRWVARADVLVSSSMAEGCPNNILEALCLGKKIVATDCPGDTAILLKNGKRGRTVQVGDSASMAEAILAALEDPNSPNGSFDGYEYSREVVVTAYLAILLPVPSFSVEDQQGEY